MKKVSLITNGVVFFIVLQKLFDILYVGPSETSKEKEGSRILVDVVYEDGPDEDN